MRRSACSICAITILVWAAAIAVPQSTAAAPASDGLPLLRQVAQKYADAHSYYLEVKEEERITTAYEQTSRKTLLTAAEAPGNRYHYEGHSTTGSALKISDGSKVWSYQVDAHRYTVKPQPSGSTEQPAMIDMSEMARMTAEGRRSMLASLVKDLKSAQLLPERTITIDGKPVRCEAVRVQNADEKRVRGSYTFDRTIYIDEARKTIVRMTERVSTQMQSGSARIPMEQETTTTYAVTELDGQVRDSLFTFNPPGDARLVAEFPNPADDPGGASLTGEQIPSLMLKSGDGKVTPIESFRGKPVLIDFWATWCPPCVASLPNLAAIYAGAKDTSLVVIGIDQDEEAKTATDFLAGKGYSWPDYHDGDGQIEKTMGTIGIPRMVLIDAQGQIVFDSVVPTEDRLRKAIASLGPEYGALFPKPKTKGPPVHRGKLAR